MNREQEMAVKVERLRQWINDENASAVLLQTRSNFAWLTAGGLSYISAASEMGVGSMLVTPNSVALVANNIEAQRFVEEELAGLAVDVIEFPWHEATGEADALAKVVDTDRLLTDQTHGDAITTLRSPLTAPEIERYRAHGQQTTEITEKVCHAIKPGMTENDIAAMLYQAFAVHNVQVPVCLIAADDRISTRRHPIYTGKPIDKRVMVVVCAEAGGLWTNLTRMINFEPLDGALKIKHRACCQVDVTANHVTTPGRKLNEIFADIVAEYANQGFADEWQLHHQGGSTGYHGRDAFANPTCDAAVVADQAFAWNPSITGTKSEDTMLVTEAGVEFFTKPGEGWPTVEIERDGVTYRRADILVVD
jgi:Xaa-Pro aminopeptidase